MFIEKDKSLSGLVYAPGPFQAFCLGDINHDGIVDLQDLVAVIINWSPCR